MSFLKSFVDIRSKESIEHNEELILEENSLTRIEIAKITDNLFSCVSYCLYMTTSYSSIIKSLIISFLLSLINKKLLPRRMQFFYNNNQILENFIQGTTHSSFDLINLELISLLFEMKVTIYEINNKPYLQNIIINPHLNNGIQLIKNYYGGYDVIHTLNYTKKHSEIKSIVNQIIELCFKEIEIKNRMDSDLCFDQLNDEIKKFSENNFFHIEEEKEINYDQSKDKYYSCHLLDPIQNLQITTNSLQDMKIDNENTVKKNIENKEIFKFSNKSCAEYEKSKLDIYEEKSTLQFIQSQSSYNDFMPDFNSSKNISNLNYFHKEKLKPVILEESNIKYLGIVKFFDEIKNFGFIIMDINNSEIFFHLDDFGKKVKKEELLTFKNGNILRVSFSCMKYIGKYNISLKATEIELLSNKKNEKKKV